MGSPSLTVLRVVWATLPLTAGPAVEGALDGPSTAVRVVLATAAFGAWAAGLLALLVPRVLSLTVLRVLAPAALGGSVVAAVAGGGGPVDLLGVAAAAVALVLCFAPTVVDALVDGSSYGPERRLPLRTPLPIAIGPAPLAVAIVVAGTLAGPLLLAARQWVLGVVVLAAGLAATAGAARALHGLSLRFLVFVPGGLVVHDGLALADPVLLAKGTIAGIGPAPAGTDATDLTLGAGGLVIEVRLAVAVEYARRAAARRPAEIEQSRAVLVSPLQPAVLLREAGERGLGRSGH